jgi:hypothetical protein
MPAPRPPDRSFLNPRSPNAHERLHRCAVKFTAGSAVELNINDSALFGVVTHSVPERSFFRTGVEVWQVLIGRSELAELLKETLQEAMPNQQLEYSDPAQFQ